MKKSVCLTLIAVSLSACQSAPTQPTEKPPYQTQSDRQVESLAICVRESGKEACRGQAMATCDVIQREAFNNPFTRNGNMNNFNKADDATKKKWKVATANNIMRRIGYGNICS